MKRQNHLFEHIVAFSNLLYAAKKAMLGKMHKPTVARFNFNLEYEVIDLQNALQTATYQPRPYYCFQIREPKVRDICAANIRDRVVHHAICNIIEPYLEKRQIYDSYACRVGKGTHAAIKRAQHFSGKYRYFMHCDIHRFFASVDHQILKKLLARIFKDRDLLNLLAVIIDYPTSQQKQPIGLPIGNLTSQHFANLYLAELDHYIKDRLGIKAYLRYMDDFLLFAHDKKTLHELKELIDKFLSSQLQLSLNPKIMTIAPRFEGISFLGFRIFPRLIRLNQKTLRRFRKRMKYNEKAWLKGTMEDDKIIQSVSSIYAHIQHANTYQLRKSLLSTKIDL